MVQKKSGGLMITVVGTFFAFSTRSYLKGVLKSINSSRLIYREQPDNSRSIRIGNYRFDFRYSVLEDNVECLEILKDGTKPGKMFNWVITTDDTERLVVKMYEYNRDEEDTMTNTKTDELQERVVEGKILPPVAAGLVCEILQTVKNFMEKEGLVEEASTEVVTS